MRDLKAAGWLADWRTGSSSLRAMSVGQLEDNDTSPVAEEVEIVQVIDDNDKEEEQKEIPDTFLSDVIDRRKVGLKKNNKFFYASECILGMGPFFGL